MDAPQPDVWQIAALLLSSQRIIAAGFEPIYDVGEQACATLKRQLALLLDSAIQEAYLGSQHAWADALAARRKEILSVDSAPGMFYQPVIQLSNLLLVALTEMTARGHYGSAERIAGQMARLLQNFDDDLAELALQTARHPGNSCFHTN